MRDRQSEVVNTGIPLLSDIPIFGGLFGSQERRSTDTELFIFITPTVLYNDDDSRDATDGAIDLLRERGVDVRRQIR